MRSDINHADGVSINTILENAIVGNAGQIAANILDYRDQDHAQTTIVTGDGIFYGVEGIRINELLVRPVYSFAVIDHTNVTGPAGNWLLTGSHYENATPEMNGIKGIWWFDNIRPGKYYARLYGTGSGQIVGDVKIGTSTHLSLPHGGLFESTVTVADDGRLKISIGNGEIATPGFTTYFAYVELIEQPDCEYVELINITPHAVDVSDWYIEGLRDGDLIATIPAGTTIESFDYIVLAVDKDDGPSSPTNLQGNNMSLEDVWEDAGIDTDKIVQLFFSDVLSRADDIINDTPTADNTVIVLKDSYGRNVDEVKYNETHAALNRSIERDDPSSSQWSDASHIFDQWNYSNGFTGFVPEGTPTQQNNNINILGHTFGGINTEVLVRDRSFASVGELTSIPAGNSWSRVSLGTLEVIADNFCVSSLRVEAEGHAVVGSQGNWQEITRSAPQTNWFISNTADDVGQWLFDEDDRLHNGLYHLTVYGNYSQALCISIKRADGTWIDFSPALSPKSDHAVRYGVVDIGGDSADATPSKTLEIKIKNCGALDQAAFDCIVLSPTVETVGRININTAPVAVMQALPGVTTAIAQRIHDSAFKPYGDQYGLGDIVHDTIISDDSAVVQEVFRKIANVITVHSDVFEVIITAETFDNNRKTASKKLRTVVER